MAVDGPRIVFRNVTDDGLFGKVAVSRFREGAFPRSTTKLACDRVHFAGGRGLCLVAKFAFANGYEARILGPDLSVRFKLPLAGIPSRARVSADGRYGAATVFVTGDSYADADTFSTRTVLIDMTGEKVIAELEQFGVVREGRSFRKVDFNFWGVTFARDSDRFYATLATGGKTYLAEGSVEARQVSLLRENVECPSVSPDGTRIAFKKRIGDSGARWQLHVLDLLTMTETPLPGTEGVDDQAEWLDDERVLYSFENDVRVVAADGKSPSRLFIPDATSPAAVRS